MSAGVSAISTVVFFLIIGLAKAFSSLGRPSVHAVNAEPHEEFFFNYGSQKPFEHLKEEQKREEQKETEDLANAEFVDERLQHAMDAGDEAGLPVAIERIGAGRSTLVDEATSLVVDGAFDMTWAPADRPSGVTGKDSRNIKPDGTI